MIVNVYNSQVLLMRCCIKGEVQFGMVLYVNACIKSRTRFKSLKPTNPTGVVTLRRTSRAEKS
jgi:hypothetical protein